MPRLHYRPPAFGVGLNKLLAGEMCYYNISVLDKRHKIPWALFTQYIHFLHIYYYHYFFGYREDAVAKHGGGISPRPPADMETQAFNKAKTKARHIS